MLTLIRKHRVADSIKKMFHVITRFRFRVLMKAHRAKAESPIVCI